MNQMNELWSLRMTHGSGKYVGGGEGVPETGGAVGEGLRELCRHGTELADV